MAVLSAALVTAVGRCFSGQCTATAAGGRSGRRAYIGLGYETSGCCRLAETYESRYRMLTSQQERSHIGRHQSSDKLLATCNNDTLSGARTGRKQVDPRILGQAPPAADQRHPGPRFTGHAAQCHRHDNCGQVPAEPRHFCQAWMPRLNLTRIHTASLPAAARIRRVAQHVVRAAAEMESIHTTCGVAVLYVEQPAGLRAQGNPEWFSQPADTFIDHLISVASSSAQSSFSSTSRGGFVGSGSEQPQRTVSCVCEHLPFHQPAHLQAVPPPILPDRYQCSGRKQYIKRWYDQHTEKGQDHHVQQWQKLTSGAYGAGVA